MKALSLLLLLLVSFGAQAEEHLVFFGRWTKEEYIPEAEPACPASAICMNAVIRWQIRISEVISGSPPGKVLKAARIQHALHVAPPQADALIVVHKIDDPAKRMLLGADYWVDEYAPPETTYCIRGNEDYGLSENDRLQPWDLSDHCYGRLQNN